MFSAFYGTAVKSLSMISQSLIDVEESDEEEDQDYEPEPDEEESSDEESETEIENENGDEVADPVLESFCLGGIRRNPCLAHLLQLGIKDALKKFQNLKALKSKVTRAINFFTKSPKFYEKLRQKTQGLSLVKPCETRWNGFFDCCNRLLRVKVK